MVRPALALAALAALLHLAPVAAQEPARTPADAPGLADAPGEIVAREGKGWLERRADGRRVLHVRGTPYEMGFQHGRLLRDDVRSMTSRVVDAQGELGRSDAYMAYLLMRDLMHEMLRPHLPPRFVEEMRGLADGSGVPYADVEAGNLFPEAFHCSGIALRGPHTAGGALLHVRILDYMTRLGLQDVAVVRIVEPEGGRRWLDVGFAGFVGTVTGMNDAQVAIGEMGGQGLGMWDGVPMSFLLRDALERAGTLEEAVRIFRETKRTCEYYYVLSDGKSRDAVGLWTTPEVFETIRMGESYALFEGLRPRGAAAGDKAFARGLRVEQGPHGLLFRGEGGARGFLALQPADALVISGPDRYQHFCARLAARAAAGQGPLDVPALIELVKRPVSMKDNLHVAIFRPETLEAWVAVAAPDGAPACDQPYARFTLASDAGAPADGGAKK